MCSEWSPYEGGVWLQDNDTTDTESLSSETTIDSDYDIIADVDEPETLSDAIEENLKAELNQFQKDIVEFNKIMDDLTVDEVTIPPTTKWGGSLVKLESQLDAKRKRMTADVKVTIIPPTKSAWDD